MIEYVKFCFNHGSKIKRLNQINFNQGYNVIVGKNGSGKSTILEAISECNLCEKKFSEDNRMRLFNAELINPHTSDGRSVSYLENLLKIRAQYSSHGQIAKAVLSTIGAKGENCILLEEPETGQDPESMIYLRESFRLLSQKGIQFVVTTLNPLFIFGNVIELNRDYAEKIKRFYRTNV